MEVGEQRMIDALYRISRLVNETDTIPEALESILDAVMKVLPASSATIELVNPDNGQLEIEVYRGFQPEVETVALKVGEGITGWVALHGKPCYVPDVRTDARYIPLSSTIRSELAVPLLGEDQNVLGVINVDSEIADAFSRQHQQIMVLLAAEASRVLNRIWLIRHLRDKSSQLKALITTSHSIVGKGNLPDILQIITDQAIRILRVPLAAIFILDPKDQSLVLEASSGIPDVQNFSERTALAESAIGTAIRRRKLVEIRNLPRTEEHHFISVIQKHELVSLLVCPIIVENEPIGVLNLYTRRIHRFNNDEREMTKALAYLGAIAIQNARLYERIFQSEESLRKTEQLTTLGLLSAEIAHEIRNPLTVIRLLFESLTLDFPESDPRSRDVAVISEKLDQLESTVTSVLNFGKSREDIRSRFDLNSLTEDTLHLVRLKFKQQSIDLSFEPYPEPLFVEVHKGQVQQAILNLLINASQAMPTGGLVSIETGIREDTNAPAAVFRISDTGEGIPDSIRDRIFDSFLTTRPKGTGLGLPIVQRILKSHHGSIQVESTSDKGTTLSFCLPLQNPL